jgi:hypothetical protein
MALTRFYNNLSDVDLAKEAIAKKADVYIQRFEYIGEGVLDLSTGGQASLTPTTSPSWTVNDYQSTVARNLIVYDDNNKAATAKIDSNNADEVTFDNTDLLLEEDGTTTATITAGNTYSFYVLTPSSITGNTYGPFFGYTEGIELNLNDTYMKFMYGRPKAMKFKDLDMREGQVNFGSVNITNEDIIQTIFQGVSYGNQTNQFSYGVGHDPDTDVFFRLALSTQDRNGRQLWIICRKTQVELTGNIFGEAESGHFMAPTTWDLTADGFYPENADMLQITRADS